MADNYSNEQPPKAGIDSPNNTHFNPSEASSLQQRKFEVLWGYNEEIKRDRKNVRASEVRRREQSHLLDALSSTLEVPDYQHKEAERILEDTTFTDSVEGRYLDLETYCFAIIVLVHNQNTDRFDRKYLPEASSPSNFEHFSDLQDALGIDDGQLLQALSELEYSVVENV